MKANKISKRDLHKIETLQREIDKILSKYQDSDMIILTDSPDESEFQGLLSEASCALETICLYA